MYLLDTTAVSAMRRPEREPAALRRWLTSIDVDQCFLSAITLLEIEIGVLRLARRDQRQAAPLRHWLDLVLRPLFKSRILPVDERVALVSAPFHVPDPSPERDALIGATAIVHDLTMVTRNTDDFRRFPLRLVDPWQAA
jgi:toxin FitB